MATSQATDAQTSKQDAANNQDTAFAAPTPTPTPPPLPHPSFALPTELWLQILEVDALSPTHLVHLWRSVRPVCRAHKSHVERIFATIYLPTLSLSLSLPRRNPITGAMLHAYAVPDAEVTLQGARVEGDMLIMATLPTVRDGATMQQLRERDQLSKQRLDTATSVWMWFGGAKARGKGSKVKMPLDVQWDEGDRVWQIKVQWMKLVTSYFHGRGGKVEEGSRHAGGWMMSGSPRFSLPVCV